MKVLKLASYLVLLLRWSDNNNNRSIPKFESTKKVNNPFIKFLSPFAVFDLMVFAP